MGGGGGSTREIRVRLREPHDEAQFLAYDCVLGTMLHELAHTIRGPHDAQFYKLLDELTAVRRRLHAAALPLPWGPTPLPPTTASLPRSLPPTHTHTRRSART